MNNVSLLNSEKTMSSLEIADLTRKNHKEVMRDIRIMLEQAEIDERKFALTYLDAQNRNQPCYYLPRRECDLLISGYSVKYRLLIIDRWRELEAQAPQLSTTDLLRIGYEAAQERDKLQVIVAEQAPKVAYYDDLQSDEGESFEIVAKEFGTGRNRLFDLLRENKILQANNAPYQPYAHMFKLKERQFTKPSGEQCLRFTPFIKSNGKKYIHGRFFVKATNGGNNAFH